MPGGHYALWGGAGLRRRGHVRAGVAEGAAGARRAGGGRGRAGRAAPAWAGRSACARPRRRNAYPLKPGPVGGRPTGPDLSRPRRGRLRSGPSQSLSGGSLMAANGFTPLWLAEMQQAAASSHAFILHLNVRDYAVPGVRLADFLARKLATRDIVVRYDRSAGLRFALPSMEEKARTILGLDAAQPVDPIYAALGGGQPQGQQELPKNPGAALPLLDRLLRQSGQRVAIIVEWAESLWPAGDFTGMGGADRTN